MMEHGLIKWDGDILVVANEETRRVEGKLAQAKIFDDGDQRGKHTTEHPEGEVFDLGAIFENFGDLFYRAVLDKEVSDMWRGLFQTGKIQ